MSVVLILIPLALVLVAVAAAALFWAVDSGQYDDLEGAERLALDSEEAPSGEREVS